MVELYISFFSILAKINFLWTDNEVDLSIVSSKLIIISGAEPAQKKGWYTRPWNIGESGVSHGWTHKHIEVITMHIF